MAMSQLGNGLNAAKQYEDALTVQEAELATLRRFGAPEGHMLAVQNNLAISYEQLGKHEQTLRMRQDVYFGRLKLLGEEHVETLRAANNCAFSLNDLKRFEEAKALMRKAMPVARRDLGESHELTLRMRWGYARALYENPGATLDDLREAVTTLEDADPIARRVLGSSNPVAIAIEFFLRQARAALQVAQRRPVV